MLTYIGQVLSLGKVPGYYAHKWGIIHCCLLLCCSRSSFSYFLLSSFTELKEEMIGNDDEVGEHEYKYTVLA